MEEQRIAIEELDLTVRTYNGLKRRGLNFSDEVCKYTAEEISRIRSFGSKSMDNLQKALSARGLKLREE